MLEELEINKEYHETKIRKYKQIQKLYHPLLWAISIVYFIYFMFIDNAFSLRLIICLILGLILWGIGLAICSRIAYHLKEKQNILHIETLNAMQENKFLSPGRKERHIKDYNETDDGLEKIMIYAKFMLEAKERQKEIEEDAKDLDIK